MMNIIIHITSGATHLYLFTECCFVDLPQKSPSLWALQSQYALQIVQRNMEKVKHIVF